MKSEASIVRQIIKRHGEVINLKEHPEVIIDILRRFGSVFQDDGGLPPGGTPEPPPGPSSFQDLVSNQDLMKQLLKISRDLAKLRKELAAR
jgi:hypothetical protein